MAKSQNAGESMWRAGSSARRGMGAVAALAAFFPTTAYPQQVCASAEVVLERFRIDHGELPAVAMTDQRGNRLVILANPATRSWSLFVMPPANDAIACLVATGQEFGGAPLQQGRPS